MKKLIALLLFLFAFPVLAWGAASDTLNLQITMTTGERGRDSSSTTKSITITGDTIFYNVTYGGRNRGRMPEQDKQFKLNDADRMRLIEIIKEKNLLVTESVEREEELNGNYFYFALTIRPEINGSKGLIKIRGPKKSPDIKDTELYKNAAAFVEAVYDILHRMDNEIDYQPLIR